jgi:hypothetical protein
MSGGRRTTTTASAPTWAAPYQQEAARIGNEVFRQQQPQLQAAANALYGGYNQLADRAFQGGPELAEASQSALGLFRQLAPGIGQDDPSLAAAHSFLTGRMNAPQSNPFLDRVISQAGDDIRANVNRSFANSGMFGSSANQDVLARRIGDVASNMRYGDFARQQADQMQAAGMLPSIVGAQTSSRLANVSPALQSLGMLPGFESARYAGVYPAISTLNSAAGLPFQGLNSYGNLLSNLVSSQGTTSTRQGGGIGAGDVLGGALMAASLFSDARLKEDVKRVGRTDGGQAIYTYRYRGSPVTHMGVLAHESPSAAVVTDTSGFLRVDYGKVV